MKLEAATKRRKKHKCLGIDAGTDLVSSDSRIIVSRSSKPLAKGITHGRRLEESRLFRSNVVEETGPDCHRDHRNGPGHRRQHRNLLRR